MIGGEVEFLRGDLPPPIPFCYGCVLSPLQARETRGEDEEKSNQRSAHRSTPTSTASEAVESALAPLLPISAKELSGSCQITCFCRQTRWRRVDLARASQLTESSERVHLDPKGKNPALRGREFDPKGKRHSFVANLLGPFGESTSSKSEKGHRETRGSNSPREVRLPTESLR